MDDDKRTPDLPLDRQIRIGQGFNTTGTMI
jgi:hypothetical protein